MYRIDNKQGDTKGVICLASRVVRCVLFEGSLKLNWSHKSELAIDWIHRDVRRSNFKSYRLAIETRCSRGL